MEWKARYKILAFLVLLAGCDFGHGPKRHDPNGPSPGPTPTGSPEPKSEVTTCVKADLAKRAELKDRKVHVVALVESYETCGEAKGREGFIGLSKEIAQGGVDASGMVQIK